MLISTFNTQLQKKHPQAIAYVPDAYGKGKRQANQVNVVYSPNGKVYEYKGTLLAIAEKLNLIPQIETWNEAQVVAGKLQTGLEAVSYPQCSDSVQYILGQVVEYTEVGQDDFGRQLVSFKIASKSEWV